jgi:hypothetical protein
MSHFKAFRILTLSLLAGSLLLTSCSGGGGSSSGSSSGQGGFQLTSLTVLDGAVWEINRQMEFSFNEAVNFNTVSLNTINIQTLSGMPATGSFFMKGGDDHTVVFQPACPILADLSDAGLQPGAVAYRLVVAGVDSGAPNTIRSEAGARLQITQIRNFTTPASTDPAGAFIDTVSGATVPVIRAVGSSSLASSYLALAGNDAPAEGVFFEFDDTTQTYSTSIPGFEVPLNLFSDDDSAVAVMLLFNQPVSPSETNISSERVRLEFRDFSGAWNPIDTRVTLVANCTQTGAIVKLEPVGILPSSSEFRTVVRQGFQDIVGNGNLLEVDRFGVVPTTEVNFDLDPPGDLADEMLEEFLIGGTSSGSFEDEDALFSAPSATWSGGQLTAAFDFEGDGGPNGEFDWVISSGDTVFFDTTSQSIVGGPFGVPTYTQNTVNGVVDVRNFIIEEDAILRVQGPHTMTVIASGEVTIRGTLDLSGFNAKDVATLNTGHQPEVGAVGAAGGGRGGTASWIINNSTPRGGTGWGAFDLPNAGGQGGESGFATGGSDNRRPGGGGGGKFAQDQTHYASVDPLAASPGNNGHGNCAGATTNLAPARGGDPGPGPFADGDDDNNFFGVFPVTSGGTLQDLIRGEMTAIGAGAGGGGGGDAVPGNQFPHPNWSISTDEKGGGGGGGAGGLNIRALGVITFGNAGTIVSDGGMGATGENTIFLDHVGGSGGSGSGGHIILETAAYIDFTDGNPATAPDRQYITANGGPLVVGNTQYGPSLAQGWSFGGPGGPGVIQLHVPDPITQPGTNSDFTDIVVPVLAVGAQALQHVAQPGALAMIPLFGARSQARSRWISIGGADQDPVEGEELVTFAFRGTDLVTVGEEGYVLATGGAVDELTPLLAEAVSGSATVAIEADGVTLRIDGVSLDPITDVFDDIYLRTPALLKNFLLRLTDGGSSHDQDFDVTSASYDDDLRSLTVTVDDSDGTLEDFDDGAGGVNVSYELIPRFFRVRTGDTLDALPDSAYVKITFDATIADQFGDPDDAWASANTQVQGVHDIEAFNTLLTAGELQFFRFNIEFDLDADGSGVTSDTEPVSLEFVRIPFRF